jgi:hypothetical protein
MLLVVVFVAPVVGWAAMGLCWLFAGTYGKGGPDIGVAAVGATAAGIFVLAYARRNKASRLALGIWPVTAFALIFTVTSWVLVLMSAGFSGVD